MDTLQSTDHSLNVSLVNQLLRNNDITVTLQWSGEAGAVYHVNVLPEISHTELTTHSAFCLIDIGLPELAVGGFPLGLGLVVEDRPFELSCKPQHLCNKSNNFL